MLLGLCGEVVSRRPVAAREFAALNGARIVLESCIRRAQRSDLLIGLVWGCVHDGRADIDSEESATLVRWLVDEEKHAAGRKLSCAVAVERCVGQRDEVISQFVRPGDHLHAVQSP